MQPSDIATLLKNFGFSGLSLVKTEGTNYTFKFDDFNLKKLNSMFGTPSIAGGGKVAVFVVPEYGKLGVSPINRMVRLAYTGTHQKTEYDDTHLGQHETTQELNLLYEKAKVNPAQKTKFITALWEYFNKEKFQGRLPVPRLMTSLKPPVDGASKNVRGLFIYDTKKLYGPGTLWISDRIFNAKEAFINEVVLHEMCVTGDTLVDTDRGPIRMDKLGESDAKVRTRRGFASILKWWKSGDEETLTIRTESGLGLRLTGNHPVLVRKWYGYKWVDARDLRIGDQVLRLIDHGQDSLSS
jgi:hypothetical protein